MAGGRHIALPQALPPLPPAPAPPHDREPVETICLTLDPVGATDAAPARGLLLVQRSPPQASPTRTDSRATPRPLWWRQLRPSLRCAAFPARRERVALGHATPFPSLSARPERWRVPSGPRRNPSASPRHLQYRARCPALMRQLRRQARPQLRRRPRRRSLAALERPRR